MSELTDRFHCHRMKCDLTIEDCLFRQRLVFSMPGRCPRDISKVVGNKWHHGHDACQGCSQGGLNADDHPGYTIPKERIHAMYERRSRARKRRSTLDAMWWAKVTK